MGTYTDFYFTLFLKDITKDIDRILDAAMYENEDFPKKLPKHEFFKCDRWECVFGEDFESWRSWDEFFKDQIRQSNITTIHGTANFKNYNNEIAKFIDWLKPYLVGGGAWSHCENNVFQWQVSIDHGLLIKEEMKKVELL